MLRSFREMRHISRVIALTLMAGSCLAEAEISFQFRVIDKLGPMCVRGRIGDSKNEGIIEGYVIENCEVDSDLCSAVREI